MVLAQDAGAVGEDLLEQSYGLDDASHRQVAARYGILTLHVLNIGGDRAQGCLGIVKAPR